MQAGFAGLPAAPLPAAAAVPPAALVPALALIAPVPAVALLVEPAWPALGGDMLVDALPVPALPCEVPAALVVAPLPELGAACPASELAGIGCPELVVGCEEHAEPNHAPKQSQAVRERRLPKIVASILAFSARPNRPRATLLACVMSHLRMVTCAACAAPTAMHSC
jgi:hypothetical protein